MFQKILVANRGEIAVRIIRACREMGIKTVAVYSEADKEALHTMLADEAICIGPAASSESYLDMERILSACVIMKADAIHPGFGFLSENARFAELCEKCGIRFIGPSAEIIHKMGNKSEARKTMMEAGVPVIPGSKNPVFTIEEGLKTAKEVGFPVMIKASSGGGGKGMRISESEEDFDDLSNARVILSFRYWRIVMEMWSIWENVTALFREDTRRCWKKLLLLRFLQSCVPAWEKLRFGLQKQSDMKMQEQLNSCWTRAEIFISWK